MYLGGIKKRARHSIVHALGDLPKPLSETDLINHIDRLKKGDKESRNILINTHLRLSMQIAASYAHKYPARRDDIISTACIAVIEAVDKAAEVLYNYNIAAWITTRVHSAIFTFILRDRLIYIPKEQVRNGMEMNILPYTISISNKVKEDIDNLEYTNDGEAWTVPPVEDDDSIVVDDFLNQLPERTRTVIQYRMDGYSNEEIGKKIGISRVRVHQLLMETGQKYRRIRDARGNKRKKKLCG